MEGDEIMALPTGNITWIPQAYKLHYQELMEADAWYSGVPQRLADFYGGMAYPSNTITGDFFGDIYDDMITPRMKFWGKEIYAERRNMLHIPIAGDIASTSANLLFAEPPKVVLPAYQTDNPPADVLATQSRLEELIQKGDVQNKLLEGAEVCAALGGVFLKINWNTDIAPYPVLSIAQPDRAFAEFEWGMLKSVTFWKVVREEETKNEPYVYRLLENHTRGKIMYGLYKGNYENLGMRIGLGALPETAGLEDEIITGVDDILVRYVANMRPNRKHRGSNYGQSDFAGLEGLMDALDEAFSSWMRDIRLGQGRLLVPESFMQKLPNGDLAFDVDQELYTMFDIDPLSAKDVGIQNVQFEIRTEQHKETVLELVNRIISSAGYSPQTFGLSISGSAESGTALNIRERKSFITKAKKERYWKPALQELFRMMLEIDSIHFGTAITPDTPNIEFQDSLTNDMAQMSSTVEILSRATALSIESKVKMVHPDFSDDEVQAEVQRIKEENGLSMPTPDQLGVG